MVRVTEDRHDIYSLVFLGREFDFAEIRLQDFKERSLLSEELLDELSLDLWMPSQKVFSASWLKVELLPERIVFVCTDPSEKLSLRDVANSFINQFNLNDNIEKIGINYTRQVTSINETEWHRVGNKLMPKDIWSETFNDDANNFGLLNYEVKQSERKDQLPGFLVIRVKPLKDFGLECLINNHIDLNDSNNFDNTATLIDKIFRESNSIVEIFIKNV